MCPHIAAADKMVMLGWVGQAAQFGWGHRYPKHHYSLVLSQLQPSSSPSLWAHLWIFVSSSMQLDEIATLGIIAPQLFVARCISYCMVYTMDLSICVLPLSMDVWCLCRSACWGYHHQLLCLRFCWTHWLRLPSVLYEALLIRNEKANETWPIWIFATWL